MENAVLTTVQLPKLKIIGFQDIYRAHSLYVMENAVLTTLQLPKLETIFGQVLVMQNPQLTTMDLRALTKVQWILEVSRNAKLTDPQYPALTSVDGRPWPRQDYTDGSQDEEAAPTMQEQIEPMQAQIESLKQALIASIASMQAQLEVAETLKTQMARLAAE